MDLQLEGKRALVTGSSTGIGKCIAEVLAQSGTTVVVHGRDEERTNALAEEIVAKGGKAFAVTGDLATDEDALQVANKAVTALTMNLCKSQASVKIDSSWC